MVDRRTPFAIRPDASAVTAIARMGDALGALGKSYGIVGAVVTFPAIRPGSAALSGRIRGEPGGGFSDRARLACESHESTCEKSLGATPLSEGPTAGDACPRSLRRSRRAKDRPAPRALSARKGCGRRPSGSASSSREHFRRRESSPRARTRRGRAPHSPVGLGRIRRPTNRCSGTPRPPPGPPLPTPGRRRACAGRRAGAGGETRCGIRGVRSAEPACSPLRRGDDLGSVLGATKGAVLHGLPGALAVFRTTRGGARPGNPGDVRDLDGAANASRQPVRAVDAAHHRQRRGFRRGSAIAEPVGPGILRRPPESKNRQSRARSEEPRTLPGRIRSRLVR